MITFNISFHPFSFVLFNRTLIITTERNISLVQLIQLLFKEKGIKYERNNEIIQRVTPIHEFLEVVRFL